MGVSKNSGNTTQNGWFIIYNGSNTLLKWDDLGGIFLLFLETPIFIYISLSFFLIFNAPRVFFEWMLSTRKHTWALCMVLPSGCRVISNFGRNSGHMYIDRPFLIEGHQI